MTNKQSTPQFSFEEAYENLEHILNTLNNGDTPLEESLKLYEQAHHLIKTCNQKLHHAEQKIETLIQSKEASPETVAFNPESQHSYRAHDSSS